MNAMIRGIAQNNYKIDLEAKKQRMCEEPVHFL